MGARRNLLLGMVASLGLVGLVAGVGPTVDASRSPVRPVGPPSSTVAIVGDSIIAENQTAVRRILEESGAPSTVIDVYWGRPISHRTRLPGGQLVTSGIDAVRAIRDAGHRPSLWVVELGTNDQWGVRNCGCPDPVEHAGMRIDRLRTEIGFDQQVLWVNVRDNSGGAAAINEALRRRVGPTFGVIDWDRETRGRDEWFLDEVHPNRAGALVLGALLARSILAVVARPLPDHCVADPPSPVAEPAVHPADAGVGDGAVAVRPARRCSLP